MFILLVDHKKKKKQIQLHNYTVYIYCTVYINYIWYIDKCDPGAQKLS